MNLNLSSLRPLFRCLAPVLWIVAPQTVVPRRIAPRIVVLWILALLAVPAFAQAGGAPALPDTNAVGSLSADLFAQSGATGMVLVVVRDREVMFRGYGETAPGSHQVPTQDSVLRLCSLTKIFTTDLLAKLVADKTVRLEDRLETFAPRGTALPAPVRLITLENLATHTSGLPRELGSGPPHTPHFTFPDYRTRWRWLPHQRLRVPPGKAAVYSNVAFDFLGDALSAAAHKPYAALLAERTLKPLGMRQTTFYPNADQCSRLLVSFHGDGPCTVTEQTEGSSGLYSNATDMATWLKYLLGTGGPGLPAQMRAAQEVYLAPAKLVSEKGLDHAGKPTGVGLGWVHILPIDSPSHIVEKTGGGAGFETYIAINHARRTALFLAAADGAVDTHLNLYNAANKLLLAVAGLPPLPAPEPKPAPRRSARPAARRVHLHRRRR